MSTVNQGPDQKDARIQSILSKISQFELQMNQLRDELNECLTEEGDGPPEAMPSLIPDGLGDHMSDLDEATESIRGKKTQAEVLEALIEHAAKFAPRAALFLIKGTALMLRSTMGFGDGSAQLLGLQVPLELDTLLRHIAQTKTSYQGSAYAHAQNGVLVEKLDIAHDEILAGAPLLIFGKVGGIVYADTGGGQGSIKLDAMEMLALSASSKLEALSAGQRAASKPAATLPAQPASPVSPSAKSASPFAVKAPAPSVNLDSLSELERAHHEAVRIAKILVQEIVLYNGTALEAGRMNGDIYDRVRADLDRSREMYERRIDMALIGHHDYFHEELVRVLCNGDPTRLGPNYPGPIRPPQ